MPFTFSHPAIVLPFGYLSKRWISMTGLVAGSVCPDFEYFFRFDVNSIYSHTWKGIFWFDLPLSIIIAFTFHIVTRNPLIDNLPPFLAKRLQVFKTFNWTQHFKKNYLAVIVSVIIGAASHIIWDGFTHKDGMFVEQIAFLRSSFTRAGYSIPIYKLGQVSGGLIGGLIILLVLLRLPADKKFIKQKPNILFWGLITISMILFIGIRFWLGVEEHFFSYIAVAGISGGLIGLLLASINMKLSRPKSE
jgi:Domain of unknown function (DUF4184)